MGTRGGCLDNPLSPLVTPESLLHLQGLPVLFITGTANEIFDPESTLRDYEMLRRRFGEHLHRRFQVEGYGHLDTIVGKSAAEDVYWKVTDHLQWCFQHHVSNLCRGSKSKHSHGTGDQYVRRSVDGVSESYTQSTLEGLWLP